MKLPLPQSWLDWTLGRVLPMSAETTHAGSGSTTRTTELSATLTARVIEVLPNGDLVVEGVRELNINGDRSVVSRALDSASDRELFSWKRRVFPVAISADGRELIMAVEEETNSTWDLHRLALAGGGTPTPYVSSTEFMEFRASFAPDGRWVALSVSPEHHDGEDWDLAIVPADGSRPVQRLP